jgi:4-amino-4-deoxy-L-arabinose transferase-like glycosyltransferase
VKNPLLALRSILNHRNAVPWLFAIYIVPRVLVLLVPVAPTSDAAWYFNRATELSAGAGYAEGGVLTAFWPPGWSMAIAVLFGSFGVSLFAVQAFNVLCSVLIGWLTLDLGRRIFESELAGRAALLLLALYPNNIAYVPLAFTEVFYTALLMGACWFLARSATYTNLLCGAVLLGFGTLVKAQTLTLIPFIYAIAYLRDRTTRNFVKSVGNAVVVALIALLVVMPWSFRNKEVFGSFIMVSTNGGLTLLTGNNPSADGSYSDSDPLVTSIERTVATQVEVDKESRKRAMAWITQNPATFISLLPRKFYHLWIRDGEGEWWFQGGFPRYDDHKTLFRTMRIVNQIYYFGLVACFGTVFAVFIFRTFRRRELVLDWWALPYALAFNLTAISLVFSGQSRFHYWIMPFVAIVCGWSITKHALASPAPVR